jgi:hypothetical protein
MEIKEDEEWSLEGFMQHLTADRPPNPFAEDITLEDARQAILQQQGERDYVEGEKKPFPGFRECRKDDYVRTPSFYLVYFAHYYDRNLFM